MIKIISIFVLVLEFSGSMQKVYVTTCTHSTKVTSKSYIMNTQEIWKDVVGYDGKYQVSNLGNIKSLKRMYVRNDTILTPIISKVGYYVISLCGHNKPIQFRIHQLMAMVYMNHIPDGTNSLVVDHINGNKLDNRLCNLQVTTNRVNTSKDIKGSSSKYTGVYWVKKDCKWRATIYIDGKTKSLGQYDDELKASQAYQKELKKINC